MIIMPAISYALGSFLYENPVGEFLSGEFLTENTVGEFLSGEFLGSFWPKILLESF